jgi:hypothetical protein
MRLKQAIIRASFLGATILCWMTAVGQQQQTIQARISGGGGSGKCTFEIRTGGTAEVDIRGGQGRVRSINGTPVQWVRLNCNQPLPSTPYGFRFAGVDGRGKQYLVQNPTSNNGIAVVRIEDNRGGMHGYTGDIMWNGGTNNGGGGAWPLPGGGGQRPPYGGGQINARVVPNCQNSIRNQLIGQRGGNLTFNGYPSTQPAASFISVQGQGTYRDPSGRVGQINYQCTMHQNGNVAEARFNPIGAQFPGPQPR